MIKEKQIVSKKRVADHGEVYTREKEVNAMLDLVAMQTQSLSATFLEPACGTGNFLIEILRRKLAVAAENYQDKHKRKKYVKSPSQLSYERDLILAVSSIYGIELLEDNVKACRKRLFDFATAEYARLFPDSQKTACLDAIECLLHFNIVWGNALSMEVETPRHSIPLDGLVTEEEKERSKKAIIFYQWSFVTERKIKRVPFIYWGLVDRAYQPNGNSLLPHPYRTVFQSSLCDFLQLKQQYANEYEQSE
ncbi:MULTISPECIES: hypothetical protein [unclassified Avibacterium]|uniref:hypothetical protein n=1 Tax=unclassified Avibacterium TaxID=2685287 RepID=UPI00218B8154|nr:hypothetical protein [Avibacterium sp. 20-129]MCW9699910.1 hypothetical protein [Avibacterium sp. 20-129]URL02159.1 hypothetical protein L4F91_00695 [Avibacterium sp. 20-126]